MRSHPIRSGRSPAAAAVAAMAACLTLTATAHGQLAFEPADPGRGWRSLLGTLDGRRSAWTPGATPTPLAEVSTSRDGSDLLCRGSVQGAGPWHPTYAT